MKTAIVGANDFIGSRLVETFHLGEGPAVVPVACDVRHPTLAARFALDLRNADPGDERAMSAALAGCAMAVYAVPAPAAERQHHASVFVHAAAHAGLRRVVYLSSIGVLGPNPPPEPAEKPRSRMTDLSAEAAAHAAAERRLLADARKAGLAATILRPGIVFGPRAPLVAALAEELRDERAWLAGTGDAVCNTLYIDNLAAAVRLALKAKAGAGQAYVVTDAETVTWRDFLHALARELDFPTRRIADRDVATLTPDEAVRAALQQATAKLSFVPAARDLGYAPPVPFSEAIRRTAAWWRFAQGEVSVAA